jgi:hypothetical protein
MAQQMVAARRGSGGGSALPVAVPVLAVRLVCALLALAVSTAHVADQGGITAFTTPDWIGWSYRLIEAGGVLTAIALLLPWSRWLGWAAGVLLGLGPFAAYLLTRTIGLPGDPGDVGNWGDWVGTLSLFVEAAMVVVCACMLLGSRRRHSRSG